MTTNTQTWEEICEQCMGRPPLYNDRGQLFWYAETPDEAIIAGSALRDFLQAAGHNVLWNRNYAVPEYPFVRISISSLCCFHREHSPTNCETHGLLVEWATYGDDDN